FHATSTLVAAVVTIVPATASSVLAGQTLSTRLIPFPYCLIRIQDQIGTNLFHRCPRDLLPRTGKKSAGREQQTDHLSIFWVNHQIKFGKGTPFAPIGNIDQLFPGQFGPTHHLPPQYTYWEEEVNILGTEALFFFLFFAGKVFKQFF